MNQTIHMHQVLHAFAHRADVLVPSVRATSTSPGLTNDRNGKRVHSAGARRVVTAILVLAPLIVTELALGTVAPDGRIADVLNQTAQLLELAQPFLRKTA